MAQCELYKDKSGEWRWRHKAANGEEVAASTEGYKNKADAKANGKKYGPCTSFKEDN